VSATGGGVTTGAGHLYPNFGHLFFEKYTPRTIETTTMTIMIAIATAPIYVDFENNFAHFFCQVNYNEHRL